MDPSYMIMFACAAIVVMALVVMAPVDLVASFHRRTREMARVFDQAQATMKHTVFLLFTRREDQQ